MYRLLLSLTLVLPLGATPYAQQLVDFEGFALEPDTFRNGASLAGDAFDAGAILLPNTYTSTPEFESWSGWSISSKTDSATAGFMNQYSARPGAGAQGTDTYAVGFGTGTVVRVAEPGSTIEELYLTNSTYAALSMREGDSFAKRFGGASGDDSDFFSVTFRGVLDGTPTADSVTFYLADFRADDPADDYIVTDWRALDLSVLGPVDSLTLSFASSDVGEFGINTPQYVCIDQVSVTAGASALRDLAAAPAPAIAPNPVADVLRTDLAAPTDYLITDARGRRVAGGMTTGELAVGHLSPGLYLLRLKVDGTYSQAARFVRSAR